MQVLQLFGESIVEPRLPRKLVAILYADVAGYSRLTGEDEDSTHRSLKESLDLISQTVVSHHGRVMHYAGDAVLAMFDAVVDSVSCAASIQRDLEKNQEDVPDGRKIEFRIGLNLGDVIEDRGDIYGDGVNVAARLESLAEPGGICISESVFTAVGSKLPLEYEDLGDREVKNIQKPVRVYRARLPDGTELPKPTVISKKKPEMSWLAIAAICVLFVGGGLLAWFKPWDVGIDVATVQAPPKLPDKPSLVVLPLKNLSGEPDQDSLSGAITEDITNQIARFSELFIISSNSANVYRDGIKTPKMIGRELGVRYVLTGSTRRAGDRLRVTMQLIEAESEAQVWTEKYDRTVNDIFIVQDEIVHSVVTSLGETIWRSAAANLTAKPLSNFAAFDYHLKAKDVFHKLNKEANEEARQIWSKASKLDPDFGLPYLGIAWTYYLEYRAQWVETGSEVLDTAGTYIQKASEVMGDSYEIHRLLSKISQVRGEIDKALTHIERALELNPSDGDLLATYAQMLNYSGEV